MTILRFFDRLLLRWNREHAHVVLACAYGLYLWIGQSIDQSPGPGMRVLGNVAHAVAPEIEAEALWGSVMIGGGLLALLGVLTGQVAVRNIAAGLLAALWLLMAACFWTANHRSPGFITYLVFAFGAITRAWQIIRRDPSSPAE